MYEVNRSLFLLIPREPFWHWLHSIGADLSDFTAELADWCEDDSLWPDLHPDIFAEWFDIRTATVVTDLTAEPLAREAFQPLDLD